MSEHIKVACVQLTSTTDIGRNIDLSSELIREAHGAAVPGRPGEEEEELLEGLVVPPHHRIEHAHRRGGRGRRRGRRGGRR